MKEISIKMDVPQNELRQFVAHLKRTIVCPKRITVHDDPNVSEYQEMVLGSDGVYCVPSNVVPQSKGT